MKTLNWIVFASAALSLAGCASEYRSDGEQASTGTAQDSTADGMGEGLTLENGDPGKQAARFRAAIEEATAAEDFDGAIEQIRKMSDYMSSLSDDDRWDFAAYWEEPPLPTWLEQTTATLEADALRNLKQRTDAKN